MTKEIGTSTIDWGLHIKELDEDIKCLFEDYGAFFSKSIIKDRICKYIDEKCI